MREVAVLGIGQTPISEHWDKPLHVLAGEAAFAALQDAGINHVDSIFVGNMMSASANHQQHLGAMLADWIGMRYREALHIEAACSSGSASFRAAVMSVASGTAEVAMGIGVEKMSDSPGNEITSELATAADADWEAFQGLSFVALNALIMQRYLYEYGWKKEHFAPFSINAHNNATNNPNARLRNRISESDYQKAAMIADPINLLDASPMGDGAAAVILVPTDSPLINQNNRIIRIVGSASATDSTAIHDRKDPLWLRAAEKSSKMAYTQAGLSSKDIDFFELHDAFSIMAALSLEASGFAERGQGPRMAMDGDILLNGKLPIATLGGLKARGHPVGATGMYQIVEVIMQLRGLAGKNQIEHARIGMAQNIGGSGSNILTHILRCD